MISSVLWCESNNEIVWNAFIFTIISRTFNSSSSLCLQCTDTVLWSKYAKYPETPSLLSNLTDDLSSVHQTLTKQRLRLVTFLQKLLNGICSALKWFKQPEQIFFQLQSYITCTKMWGSNTLNDFVLWSTINVCNVK